ncbi:CxC2 domain-containing protein [Mycena kentingensis (nom. inval.)]|nr:CxC2 domain-containing protein [Mycena kentingensis (nom. inval.)]
MPLTSSVPSYLRHLFSEHIAFDGNFKQNLFYKRDNGSDIRITDGRMYFPSQEEAERVQQNYVINPEDLDPVCKAHIGSIRNQGKFRYKNTRYSGVVAAACCHGLPASFVDMIVGEAFMLVTYAQALQLRQKNTPPFSPELQWARVNSYDSYCSWVVGQLRRIIQLYPDESWLHDLVRDIEGQIPGGHILGHGDECQKRYQSAYFPCRAHFPAEIIETIWPNLNQYSPSLRQMTASARHDNFNYAVNAWNMKKTVRIHLQLCDEREEALRVLAQNLAHFKQLTQEAGNRVKQWSRQARTCESRDGSVRSVFHHNMKSAATLDDVLESLNATIPSTITSDQPASVQWIRWGMDLERAQSQIAAYLRAYREHPLQDTLATIDKLREDLNGQLDTFRRHQIGVLHGIILSDHNTTIPEETAIQLPSYLMQTGVSVDPALVQHEIQLRCAQANTQIIAVRDKSITLSIVKSSRGLDYRGQAGITRSQRRKEHAQMFRDLEITAYATARDALISLKYMAADATAPFPIMKISDTMRKDTHLFRMRGDSRLVDDGAWLLSVAGPSSLEEDISGHAGAEEAEMDWEDAEEPEAQMGTQMLKRSAPNRSRKSPRKRQKTTAKPAKKVTEGWIWKEDALLAPSADHGRVAQFKEESLQVQWYRAEAEVFRWLEQYERKHADMWRAATRFRYDADVWQQRSTVATSPGAAAYCRSQGAMWGRLATNAQRLFREGRGAHSRWVQATSFDDLVLRIDASRDDLLAWMETKFMLIPKARAALSRYGHQVVIGNELHTRKYQVVFVERREKPLPPLPQEADVEVQPTLEDSTMFVESWLRIPEDAVNAGQEIEAGIVQELMRRHEAWIGHC